MLLFSWLAVYTITLATNYTVWDDAITRQVSALTSLNVPKLVICVFIFPVQMGLYFNNRPLYGNHNGLLVLCGDRPMVKFSKTPFIDGQMMIGLQPGPNSSIEWFHDIDPSSNTTLYTSAYTAGKFQWNITSRGVVITWIVAPLVKGIGFASRIITSGTPSLRDMSLVFAFGGAHKIAGGRPLGWTYDGAVNPRNLADGWSPSTARGNTVVVHQKKSFTVTPKLSTLKVLGQVYSRHVIYMISTLSNWLCPRHHLHCFPLIMLTSDAATMLSSIPLLL